MSGLGHKMIWLLLALGLLAGCGGAQSGAVEPNDSPGGVAEQSLAFDGDYNEACFSDDSVDINLRAHNDQATVFELDLTNKTPGPLVVRWDQVVFLDASGNRQYMIHQGVAYGDPLALLVPGVVPPQASLRDLLGPAKLVANESGKRLAPLSRWKDASSLAEQRLRIDLPLEIYGRVYVYRFRIHVELPSDDEYMKGRGRY
jgi:hypothetical protein